MMRCLALHRWGPPAALVTVVVLSSACGLTTAQKDAVSLFGRASKGFGGAVSTELVDMRNVVIDLNSNVLVLEPAKLRNRDALDGAFSLANVNARVRAGNVLQTYGELLVALVESTQAKELQAAAGSFTSSVRGLDRDKVALSDGDLDAIGKLVQAAGGLIVEHKKAEALKGIVPKAHKQVEVLGNLFASELKPDGGLLREYFKTVSEQALSATDPILTARGSTVSDRSMAATAHRKGIEARRKTEAVFPDLHKGALEMVAAHQKLVDALVRGSVQIEDIKNFAKTAESVVASARVLVNR